MASAGITLVGGKALERKLQKLGDRIHRKVTRQAVNAAANPILKEAKADVEVDSGLLKKALGKKVITADDKQSVTALIGARKQVQGEVNGKIRKPSRYAHLVEKGFIDEAGNHHPPQPYLEPALESAGPQALTILQTKMAQGIEREARKAV